MTRESKRQCLSPISTSLVCNDTQSLGNSKQTPTAQTSLVSDETHSLGKSKQMHRLKVQQLAITMAQSDRCDFELRADGSILMTPLTLYQLPNEVLTNILNHVTDSLTLYECTLTSKRWYALAHPVLWKAPVFRNSQRFLDCMVATRSGALIHDLDLTNMYVPEDDLLALLPHTPNLQHLTLTSNIRNKTARRLPPHLRSLTLFVSPITKIGLIAIAQRPLEHLDWTLASTQTPAMLAHLLPCPLRRLAINFEGKGCPVSVYDAVQNVQQSTPADIARVLTTPFTTIMADPSTFPHLTSLTIHWGYDVHDLMLAAFFRHHPRLEHLDLSTHRAITDATLDAMQSLSCLKQASLTFITHFTSPAIRRLINTCPLTYLDIHGCEQVVPSDFPEVSVTKWGVLHSSELDKIRASV